MTAEIVTLRPGNDPSIDYDLRLLAQMLKCARLHVATAEEFVANTDGLDLPSLQPATAMCIESARRAALEDAVRWRFQVQFIEAALIRMPHWKAGDEAS